MPGISRLALAGFIALLALSGCQGSGEGATASAPAAEAAAQNPLTPMVPAVPGVLPGTDTGSGAAAPPGEMTGGGTPTAIPVQGTGGAVSVITSAGRIARAVQVTPPSSASGEARFPDGFFSIDIADLSPGQAVTVTMTLPANARPDTYIKCIGSACAAYPALINGNRVQLELRDGGAGDADGLANGVIRDPGGPGQSLSENASSSAAAVNCAVDPGVQAFTANGTTGPALGTFGPIQPSAALPFAVPGNCRVGPLYVILQWEPDLLINLDDLDLSVVLPLVPPATASGTADSSSAPFIPGLVMPLFNTLFQALNPGQTPPAFPSQVPALELLTSATSELVTILNPRPGMYEARVFNKVSVSSSYTLTAQFEILSDCSDGIDNDGDGSVDFGGDRGCASRADNDESDVFPQCADGLDNDNDGLVDHGDAISPLTGRRSANPDPQCSSVSDTLERAAAQCADGGDNDGDGKVDLLDPGCADDPQRNSEVDVAQCADGIDNDSDGTSDFPLDVACADAADNSESDPAQCADGLDNDGDGRVDFNPPGNRDPGCSGTTDNDERDLPQCSDGIDNDGDSVTDFPNDKSCSSATDTDERNPVQCADGVDNDDDALVDFGPDPGCADNTDDNTETNAPPGGGGNPPAAASRVVVGNVDSGLDPAMFVVATSRVTTAVLMEFNPPACAISATRAAVAAVSTVDCPHVHFTGTNIIARTEAFQSAGTTTAGNDSTKAIFDANPDAIVYFADSTGNGTAAAAEAAVFGQKAVDIVATRSLPTLTLPTAPPGAPPADPMQVIVALQNGGGALFSIPSVSRSRNAVVTNGKMHFGAAGALPSVPPFVSPVTPSAGPWWSIGVGTGGGPSPASTVLTDFVVPSAQNAVPAHFAAGVASRVLLRARTTLAHLGGITAGALVSGGSPVRTISNGQLRRALEEAAVTPPTSLPLNAGWGELNASDGLINKALAKMPGGAVGGASSTDADKNQLVCGFQTAVITVRAFYWNLLSQFFAVTTPPSAPTMNYTPMCNAMTASPPAGTLPTLPPMP